jgi:hypothetical protein
MTFGAERTQQTAPFQNVLTILIADSHDHLITQHLRHGRPPFPKIARFNSLLTQPVHRCTALHLHPVCTHRPYKTPLPYTSLLRSLLYFTSSLRVPSSHSKNNCYDLSLRVQFVNSTIMFQASPFVPILAPQKNKDFC